MNAVYWNAPLPALPSLRKQKIYQPYPEQGRPVYLTSASLRFEFVTVTTALPAPDNTQNLAA